MGEQYFQELFAERIGGKNYGKSNEIYKFEKIKRAKRQALKDFPNRALIDFGIGENDEMAPANVRAVMAEEINKLENRGYTDNGIQDFKDAAAEFMQREFGVQLDPNTEINHCIGTKPGLAILPAAFINPGDITIMTTPGYPVAGTHTKYLGGEVYELPLREENGFMPDLDSVPDAIWERAKILVLNFPNSPTGALPTEEFYKKVIHLAKAKKFIVVQDAAHSMLSYERPPTSFLQVEGAKDVGVEIHSMSKGFHMIGWRMGFVAGNALIVRAFGDVKDNTDSGQFAAIQKAAAAALRDAQIPKNTRAKYKRRLEKLVGALNAIGFSAKMPGGTYFLYARAPKAIAGGQRFANAEEVSQFLIREKSICTVPWDNAGAYLRFSVTYQAPTEAEEDAMMALLTERLADIRFEF